MEMTMNRPIIWYCRRAIYNNVPAVIYGLAHWPSASWLYIFTDPAEGERPDA
jgi:hypothetical protein